MRPLGSYLGLLSRDTSAVPLEGVWSSIGQYVQAVAGNWSPSYGPTWEFVGSSAGTGTVNLPAGMVEGDIVFVYSYDDTSTPTLPSGYTGVSGSSNSCGYVYGYKVMGATPDSTVSLTGAQAGAAVVFRGQNDTTIYDVSLPVLATGASGNPDPSAVTTANNGCLILAVGWLDDDNITEPTPPSGFTLAEWDSDGGAVMVAYQIQETAGAIDPGAFSSNGTDAWIARTFPIRPAGV